VIKHSQQVANQQKENIMVTSNSTITATEIVLPGQVEPSGLLVTEREIPAPTTGQLTIRMEATGMSFAEQQMRRGKYYQQPAFPFVPGYDLVGIVESVGPDIDPGLLGTRVAAIVKTGAWATVLTIEARDAIPVGDADPAEVEALVVAGITAWQMLHRVARTSVGQTIVVLGANGAVGSVLVQLARHAGIRVIGTASLRHHDYLRALGAIPVDYQDPDFVAQLRALAPEGVDAVFDHVGGHGILDSWRLLRTGGTLVSYGTASTKNDAGNSQLPIYALLGRIVLWNILPNGRHAHFYNLWGGKSRRTAFTGRLADDLAQILQLLAAGDLVANIGARIPLIEAAHAMELAESRTTTGKIVLVP
jgi:NADPH:quinone reductase-like Zn-dependent oxidoreductase